MGRRSHADGELTRANEPAVLILTSLASGPKHGYALAKDIEQFAGVTLGPGTLYGAITRLEEGGFIEPVGEEQRRRPYRITAPGRAALAKAVAQMQMIADEGRTRLGLGLVGEGWRGGLAAGWAS
jgi:DNA-binding PadR family transcriptional regulator